MYTHQNKNNHLMQTRNSTAYLVRIKKSILVIFALIITTFSLKAQTQLELSSGSMGSVSSGATTANQTATKLENTTGTTFAAFTPTITVTAALSNQQFTAIPTTIIGTGTGLLYGATANSFANTAISMPVFNAINSIGSPANGNFTSSPTGTAGTGIDVVANNAFYFYSSVHPLFANSSSLSGRFYYGDLTFTFNRPVSNPVLHISGLGGNINFGGTNIQGFSTEMELQGSATTITRLSGTSEFAVSGAGVISNNASTLSFACGSGAACGSVRVNGTNITSVTFKVFVKGDGRGTAWSNSNVNAGDNFTVSVSMNKPVTISGNVFNDVNGLTDNIVNGTGTNLSGALRVNLVDANNIVVATTTVAVDGTYSFVGIGDGNYTVQLSTNAGTQGSAAPAIALPIGIVNTGENVGSGTGSDGTINGILPVTVSGNNVSNANFGVYSCATITNPSASQAICIGQLGSNITVSTSMSASNGIRFVRFTSDQIAGTNPTATELANIYAGTPISTVTPVTGTATYAWSSADFPNATTSAITYYVYAIINPDAGTTCRPVQEIRVTVNALPVIAATTGTTTVCATRTTQLSNATASGTWVSRTPGVATINASGLVTGVSAGTATIRYIVTNGSGCSDSVSTTVT
ncbi:MAG: Ig-like domain-containing protein, partial [Chitinophagaceae bacterium]